MTVREILCDKNVRYTVFKHPFYKPSANFANEIKKQAPSKNFPEIFFWDDLYFQKTKTFGFNAKKITWPKGNLFALRCLDTSGLFAVRNDYLLSQFEDINLLTPKLYYKLFQPNISVCELEEVVRFAGIGTKNIYKPIGLVAPPSSEKSVSIIVNFKDKPELMHTLVLSLAKQETEKKVELILINNQSTPESLIEIKAIVDKHLPRSFSVKYLDYSSSFNHSAQCNFGAKNASGEILIMMNNDAHFIDHDTLDTIANWADQPQIATCGPQIVGDNHRLVSSGVQVYKNKDMPFEFGIRECEEIPLAQSVHQSVGCTFACAAITKKMWNNLNGLNEIDFPTQYNDADFFLRALRQGYQHIYAGNVRAHHSPGKSEPRTREKTLKTQQDLCKNYPEISKYLNIEIRAEKSDLKYRFGNPIDLILRSIFLPQKLIKSALNLLS